MRPWNGRKEKDRMTRRQVDVALQLARARSGATDLATVTTDQGLVLAELAAALGCWYMVDHTGLEAGRPKRVFAHCHQEYLEKTLAKLAAR
jgi:hypothetical protein